MTPWIVFIFMYACLGYDEPMPCNPFKDSKCVARNPSLGKSIFDSFSHYSTYFHPYTCSSGVQYDQEGLTLTIRHRNENPSIKSNFYILYGKVEVEILAAKGQGIVSSFYLQSDDLDEIDVMESFGGVQDTWQSNFFVKGNTSTYARGVTHAVDDIHRYHSYSIEWTPDEIVWFIDGVRVRRVVPTLKEGFPQSPMCIILSVWVGGDRSNDRGTIEWAGGFTNYLQAPFEMRARDIYVIDYSTGKRYVYGGGSLRAIGGQILGNRNHS
ncbi:hypothetical protein CAAN1_06S01046 [[Candida] anglica]|uniref:GH16 domain-containing protein n=1 Tax=[Candida] anglica TaxID=148631 RepID=A0ABP0EN40_9ASCO